MQHRLMIFFVCLLSLSVTINASNYEDPTELEDSRDLSDQGDSDFSDRDHRDRLTIINWSHLGSNRQPNGSHGRVLDLVWTGNDLQYDPDYSKRLAVGQGNCMKK